MGLKEMITFVKNILVLVFSIMIVHLIYISYIHPQAAFSIELSHAQGVTLPRNIFIILKDLEQEICIILMVWGMYLMLEKIYTIIRYKHQYHVDLIETNGNFVATLQNLETLHASDKKTPLIRVLFSSVRHYLSTQNIHHTHETIRASIEDISLEHDSDNSMIRYIIWAIPSIGFIGTVRGIGQALSQADQALAGDISGMTESLGLAFNSTLVALFISLILMFFLHQLQKEQEKTLVHIQDYCEKYLLPKIRNDHS